MSTVTLTFNLPEEETEARQAQEGEFAIAVLCDLDDRMRNVLKYGEHSAAVKDMVEELRKFLRDQCDDYGVKLD